MARFAQGVAVAAFSVGAAFTAAKAQAQEHVKTTIVCASVAETGKKTTTDCAGVTVVTRPAAVAAEEAGRIPPFKMHDVSDFQIAQPVARRPAAADPCSCSGQGLARLTSD